MDQKSDQISHSNHSLWREAAIPLLPILDDDLTADVCIVGAGVSGLSIAYFLLKAGFKVVVLDKDVLGSGETGLTTAHLSNALDRRYANLKKLHGEDGARLASESHSRAIDMIESIVAEEEIDCDFLRVDGFLFLGEKDKQTLLQEELAASHLAGLTNVKMLTNAPLRFFESGPCLKYPRQAQLHAVKYLKGLANAVQKLGGQIFTKAHVSEIKGGSDAYVRTNAGRTVKCESVVVATHVPINNLVSVHTKQAPYRSYVVGAEMPRWKMEPFLLWDTEEPYHYVRLHTDMDRNRDVLIVGGEDHRTGVDANHEDRFLKLQQWTRHRLGLDVQFYYQWSGQIMESVDGLAYIGHNAADYDNVYIATGFNGHGMTYGTIAGMLIKDLITQQENPWTALYDPHRINWKGVGQYISENFTSTLQYKDWVTSGDVDGFDKIAPDQGAVVSFGATKVAAYRDFQGQLHTCSAVCPHLGGIVHWNETEKTWDCPCHGSRFDRTGKVLNGPAAQPLAAIHKKETDLKESASFL